MHGLNMIAHIRALQRSAASVGAQLKIDMATLPAEVIREGKYFELLPVFGKGEGDIPRIINYAEIPEGTVHFCGWNVADKFDIPVRSNRLEFKSFCESNKLGTPAYAQALADPKAIVFVKEALESYGRCGRIRGPMKLSDAKSLVAGLSQETYVEEYIDGDPFQAWYFADELACVEIRKKPHVEGDGLASVQDLINRVASPFVGHDEECLRAFLALQGVGMGSVLSEKARIVLSMNYYSGLDAISIADANENVVDRLSDELLAQFVRAGKAMAGEIAETSRKHAHYCLVGVIAAGKAWFTSVGAPNHFHPDLYPKMLPRLFEIPIAVARRGVPIPAAATTIS